jgi:16S rRNA (cytosine967-C5)-methyltransferase
MSAKSEIFRPAAWPAAAQLVARWLERRERIDALFDTLPGKLAGAERARCQHLVFGVVRHASRLEAELAKLIAHPPRYATRAVLYVAGFELIEAEGEHADQGLVAKIVHHAVDQAKTLASPAEARLVNAVVRKLATALHAQLAPNRLAAADVLATYFSHPAWLVTRWLKNYGAEHTRALLKWNQTPAPVYARWRDRSAVAPEWLKATAWAGFFEVPSGKWSEVEPLLKKGKLYLQDPGTRLAVELLAPQPGETVLDVCAAPGGKSLQIADAMVATAQGGVAPPTSAGAKGRVVAMDLPGERIARLKENLARVEGVDVALVQADVAKNGYLELDTHRLPTSFDAVLLDVPCTNSGVMRHRVDVKWRLQEGDFHKHGRQQLELLHAAAKLVAPGGRIVYSTCSIDPEENESVIRAFFDSRAGGPFTLEAKSLSQPWVTGHDGAGAFLLRKKL